MPSFYPIRSFHSFYPVEPAGCDLQHVEIPAFYDLVTGNFQDALDVFEHVQARPKLIFIRHVVFEHRA
jgi:hypothetical protein